MKSSFYYSTSPETVAIFNTILEKLVEDQLVHPIFQDPVGYKRPLYFSDFKSADASVDIA